MNISLNSITGFVACAIMGVFFHSNAVSQILPNTVLCIKGTDAKPQTYCADATPCKQIQGPNSLHTVCLSGTPNPPAGAEIVSSTCWKRTTEYTCLQYNSSCGTYSSDENCTEIGTRQCTKDGESNLLLASNPKLGTCSSYTRNFSCVDPRKPTDSTYTTTTRCDINSTQNGLDWSTSSESSANDFVLAVTGQEFARQLATYGAKDGGEIDNLFPGHQLGCRDGYFGLKNCCKSSGGGAVNNNSMAKNLGSTVAMGALKEGAGYAVSRGSIYVYDTVMSNAPAFMTPGIEDILARGAYNGWAGAGFGAYGFGTTASAAGGAFGAGSSMAIGNSGLYFNPYAFALAVAIQVVMEVISCNQDEMDLANARQENLCHLIGDYCSTKIKVLGATVGCLETTTTFCCYNGLLGKAIAEGSHEQLGLSWGTPEHPICRGLTVDQLMSLDFESPAMKTALEPFRAQIMENYTKNIAPNISNGTVSNLMEGKASTNASSLCLQRQKLDPSTVCK